MADPSADGDPRMQKEVIQTLNPLAIGVTLVGQLLDVIAPRPKPPVGVPTESALLSTVPAEDTPGGRWQTRSLAIRRSRAGRLAPDPPVASGAPPPRG